MARGKERMEEAHPSMISIIGPGMSVLGDCAAEGTIRIEGVVQGSVFAGKAIVIGKDGAVTGDLRTQDAVIAGQVEGSVVAASRLEVHATARIQGSIHARRLQLEEGALLNGEVRMGEINLHDHPEEQEGLNGDRDLFSTRQLREGVAGNR